MTKVCSQCGQSKPLEDFYAHPKRPGERRAACKACMTAYKRAQVAADPVAARERRRSWPSEHGRQRTPTDRSRAYNRQYAKTHRAEARRRNREWVERDPDRAAEAQNAAAHRHRARQSDVPYVFGITRRALRERDGDRCYYCDVVMDFTWRRGEEAMVRTPVDATIDHVVALSVGGAHDWDNVCLACRDCNCGKGDGTADAWLDKLKARTEMPQS